jgi:hypothetical protein
MAMLDTTICCGGYGCNDLQDLWREPSQIFPKFFILKASSETLTADSVRAAKTSCNNHAESLFREVYHFSPLCKLPRGILDPSCGGQVHLMIRSKLRERPTCVRRAKTSPVNRDGHGGHAGELKGDRFAKAHISTAQETPRQDARVSFAHEDRRRPKSSCGTPQEGTPSPHARVRRGRSIRAARA